ncbi:MAG TPA: ACT domain-containing protein [Gemmatimonadaceae bacterium]
MSSHQSPPPHHLSLTVLAAPFALCRLAPTEPIPEWTTLARTFLTISRTPTELSIVADEAALPAHVSAERGYRAFRVDGPLPLGLIGIFAALASPLAAAAVPIFPIATYDTDYVLLHQDVLSKATAALEGAGHRVVLEGLP